MRYCFNEKGNIALVISNTSNDVSFVRNLLFSEYTCIFI